jgi:hypothetical protein
MYKSLVSSVSKSTSTSMSKSISPSSSSSPSPSIIKSSSSTSGSSSKSISISQIGSPSISSIPSKSNSLSQMKSLAGSPSKSISVSSLYTKSSNITPTFIKSSIPKQKKPIFTAQKRRKGKFISIGTFETKEAAFDAGKLNIEQNLGASTRVLTQEGKVVRPSVFSPKFYESKKEEGVLIQKRGFRLGTFGERKEIQSAKSQSDRMRKIWGGR